MTPKPEAPVPGLYREPYFSNYPKNRDVLFKNSFTWMEGKRMNDDLNGPYWRVHNKLYDLSSFADKHPGGKEWIELTKGTDITEAFESSHIFPSAEALLKKYYVKDINTPRYSPYTFHEDGFYKTLKRKIAPIIKKEGSGPTRGMLIMTDSIAFTFIALMISSVLYNSTTLAILAGLFMHLITNIAHNFFHQKDNFRMYYFDLSFFSSKEWRISHALSHHLYTNTLMDFEISAIEPFVYFLPNINKSTLYRYSIYVCHNILYFFVFFIEGLKKIIGLATFKIKFEWTYCLPYIQLALMVLLGPGFYRSLQLWIVMNISASYIFSFVGLIAAHHHPKIYHAGDQFRTNPDWGLCQLDAVRDRVEITGSLFLVSVSFGDHTLHHLFPTVDHSKLPLLYPVFLETCKEFGIPFKFIKQSDLIWGMYAQMTNTNPNLDEPGYH